MRAHRRGGGVSTIGVAVSWVNRFGFRREAVLSQLQGRSQGDQSTSPTTRSDPQLDPSASIIRTAQSLGAVAPNVVNPGELRFDRVKWLSVLVTVLMIGFTLYGPQPRRMTKVGCVLGLSDPLRHRHLLYSASGFAVEPQDEPPG
jgi:hypothetical protein